MGTMVGAPLRQGILRFTVNANGVIYQGSVALATSFRNFELDRGLIYTVSVRGNHLFPE
jgi:hypothetical protein